MELPKINFSKLNQPLRLLLEGNEDTWSSFLAVISDLTPEQLSYKRSGYDQRSIGEMINHAIDTQYGFYIKHLVLSEKIPGTLFNELPKTAKEGQQRVVDGYKKTLNFWKEFTDKDLSRKIKTEWGQVLTGELALFQSITHTHYHLSEICFLRGFGGFPTTVMGQ